MYTKEVELIHQVITDYFDGIYTGNIETLKRIFHPQSMLFGDIDGVPYLKSIDDYLIGVKNRKSPKELGQDNKMDIISVEILNNIAYAKLYVPMFEYHYYDYLSFSKIENMWIINNKTFTHA